jgi:hypothetical protein
MRFFTVHLPPGGGMGKPDPALERAVFVRDGFHFWAFLLGLLWCLWRGLWLPALAILALSAALVGMGRLLQVSSDMQMLAQLVLALLIGLEAPNLRRFGLRRHGYADRGSIAASDLTEAEAVFFARAPSPGAEPKAASSPAAPDQPFLGRAPGAQEVVGLFPEYRGR